MQPSGTGRAIGGDERRTVQIGPRRSSHHGRHEPRVSQAYLDEVLRGRAKETVLKVNQRASFNHLEPQRKAPLRRIEALLVSAMDLRLAKHQRIASRS